MIRLDGTNQVLQAVLAAPPASIQPQAVVCFSDDDSALGLYTGGKQLTVLNGTTDTTILSAPLAGVVRDVDFLSIFNRDTASVTVTVKYDVGGTDSILTTATLLTLETLVYTHSDGWSVHSASGAVKTISGGVLPVESGGTGTTTATGTAGSVVLSNGPTINTPTLNSPIIVGGSLNGGPFGGFRNKIIGGDFGTNPWQRGVNFPNVLNTSYTADRWQFNNSSTAVINIVKDTLVPMVSQAGRLVVNDLAIVVATPDVTVGAADYSILSQIIEGYNFQPLAQKPMVLSFWHAHSKPGIYCVSFRNAGADRSFVAEYTQVSSAGSEYTSIVIPPSPSAGTWNYANGIGLNVAFVLMSGTNLQTTPGVWQTGNFLATANQVNMMDAGNIFRISLVQLESGTVATPFEGRSFGEELALCQRYYEKSYDLAVAPGTANGTTAWVANISQTGAANSGSGTIPYKVRKRSNAAVASYVFGLANTLGSWTFISPAGIQTNRAVTVGNNGEMGFQMSITAAGDQFAFGHWTADAEL